MLSIEEFYFFTDFQGFLPTMTANAEAEFQRLCDFKEWVPGSVGYEKARYRFNQIVQIPAVRSRLNPGAPEFHPRDGSSNENKLPAQGSNTPRAPETPPRNGSSNENKLPAQGKNTTVSPEAMWSRQLQEDVANKAKQDKCKKLKAQFDYYVVPPGTMLQKMQRVCRDLGVWPAPQSEAACIEATKNVHANLIDFVACKQAEPEGFVSPVFEDMEEFRKYTVLSGKYYPMEIADICPLIKMFTHLPPGEFASPPRKQPRYRPELAEFEAGKADYHARTQYDRPGGEFLRFVDENTEPYPEHKLRGVKESYGPSNEFSQLDKEHYQPGSSGYQH